MRVDQDKPRKAGCCEIFGYSYLPGGGGSYPSWDPYGYSSLFSGLVGQALAPRRALAPAPEPAEETNQEVQTQQNVATPVNILLNFGGSQPLQPSSRLAYSAPIILGGNQLIQGNQPRQPTWGNAFDFGAFGPFFR